jgi:hypothetical protein
MDLDYLNIDKFLFFINSNPPKLGKSENLKNIFLIEILN